MKIIVAGHGFVGKAVENALSTKHEVVVVDPKYNSNKINFHPDADGIVICVPTPYQEKGGIDANHLVNVLEQVPVFMPVMIKSTVTPGIAQVFKEIYAEHSIVYSPEFLRARSAKEDFLNQKYMVLGGQDPEGHWQEIFSSVLPNCKLFLNCSEEEACLIKYASNSFLALKTSYFNQLYDICLNNNMNFDIVRQILSSDQRIGADHTMVPGFDGMRGWGGHCFPKDTNAFVHWARSVGSPVTLIEQAIQYNKTVRKDLDI